MCADIWKGCVSLNGTKLEFVLFITPVFVFSCRAESGNLPGRVGRAGFGLRLLCRRNPLIQYHRYKDMLTNYYGSCFIHLHVLSGPGWGQMHCGIPSCSNPTQAMCDAYFGASMLLHTLEGTWKWLNSSLQPPDHGWKHQTIDQKSVVAALHGGQQLYASIPAGLTHGHELPKEHQNTAWQMKKAMIRKMNHLPAA